MPKNLLRAGALSCALLTSTAMCTQPVLAQSVVPVRETVDERGIDLFRGTFAGKAVIFSLGDLSSGQGLAYTSIVRGARATDNVTGRLLKMGSTLTVQLGDSVDRFNQSGSSYIPTEGNGASLTYNSTTKIYTYLGRDGTVATFAKMPADLVGTQAYWEGRATSIARPNGERLDLVWDQVLVCEELNNDICSGYKTNFRLASATNAFGYRLSFSYAIDGPYDPGMGAAWEQRTDVKGVNLAVEACPANQTPCSTTGAWPTPSTAPSYVGFGMGSSGVDSVSYGIGVGAARTIAYSTSLGTARASSVTDPNGTWNYAYTDNSGARTVTVTNPLSQATSYVFDIATELLTSVTDPLSRTTSYLYDSAGRTTRITRPEGNYTQLTYDSRGNVTERREVAKSGSGLADIVTSATYASSCSNPVTCNLPTSTTDARGNTTDFTYDSSHGGILTATGPAPSGSGDRPQIRYSYGTFTTASGVSVTRLTGTSQCLTGSSCANGANERVTELTYTSGNVLPASVTTRAGDSSVVATTAMSYDDIGNAISVDGPLSGSADTTRLRYDVSRRRIGAVGPDPDGSGSLIHRAERISYTGGAATKIEIGTVASQSDTHWAAFSPTQQVDTVVNVAGQPLRRTLSAGSTTYAVSDASYDAAGRVSCTATRMNLGSLPNAGSDACTPGTVGSDGPDRITRTSYDAASRPTLVQSGYGVTGTQADEVAVTYRANGQVETLEDGEGNVTAYVHDGHDRLSRTRFPDTTQGAGTSSTTDYEELSYDAGSNITNVRLRDNTNIGLSYDALNRVTTKDLPGSEPTVTYSYDLTGNLTGASDGTQNLTFSYDALGRQLTQVSVGGTTTSVFDAAGRRTRLSWPGTAVTPSGQALYVDYDYLVTGEMLNVRERGATSGAGVLATYGYDALGRRTSVTRGNGATSSYGYDAVSRLSSLSHDLANTAHDVTFGYGYNSAGQIVSRSANNDTYSFADLANGSITDTHNGLNQIAQTAATTLSHDARGNLLGDGSATFSFDSQNRLTGASASGVTSSYLFDPLGRLTRIDASNSGFNSTLDLDGQTVIGEREAGGARSRTLIAYVPGADNLPVAQYYHGGINLDYSTRGYYHGDERGSPIVISKDSGAMHAINRYDDYGRPSSTNWGRIQYTGQYWFALPNMYHYRARAYHPGLGRFLQTDPIHPLDGPNAYAAMGGDPVNRTDPSGLCTSAADGGGCNVIIVTGSRAPRFSRGGSLGWGAFGGGFGGGGGGGVGGGGASHAVDAQCREADPLLHRVTTVTGHGLARGDNAELSSNGSRYVSDLQGGPLTAISVFYGLSRLEGEPYDGLISLDMLDGVVVSPRGGIRLSIRADRSGGRITGFSPRIDIRANAFSQRRQFNPARDLSLPETIHFRGGNEIQCPSI